MSLSGALSLAATALTPLLGLQHLLRATFIVTHCFQTPTVSGSGMVTGCGSERMDFAGVVSGAPLHLAVPLGALVVVTALAGGAWAMARRKDAISHAAYTAAYTIAVVPVTLVIGPVYIVPTLLLVAGALLFAGATAATVVREFAKGTLLVVGAFAATLAAIAVWRARLGGPQGDAVSVWMYIGIATALGIATGCVAAAEQSEPRALLRWLVISQVGFALGLLATGIALLPTFYPHGHYVNLGMASAWQVATTALVADAIVGLLALRILGRLSWLAATVATGVIGALFMLSALATFSLTWGVAGPSVDPPVPLLPSTSTLR